MKKLIILLFIAILCPIKIWAQLSVNSSLSKKDTVLNVTLENVNPKNIIILRSEYYHDNDGGSFMEVFFLDSKENIIAKSKNNFIIEEIPKLMV